VEVTDTALARIERLNPKLNAYLTVSADHARERRAAEARFARARPRCAGRHPVLHQDLEPTRHPDDVRVKFFEHNVPAETRGRVALRGPAHPPREDEHPHFGYKTCATT
jgi:hypothetical protein